MSGASPLVVRFGAFGDMVMLTPLLRIAAERHGRPCDVVTSGPWSRPLLESLSEVGDVHVLRSRNMPYWLSPDQWRLVAALKARPPGPVYLCERDDKSSWLLEKAGLGRDRIRRARDAPQGTGEHWVDYWVRFAGAAVHEAPDPLLRVTDADRDDCARWLARRRVPTDRIVLVQPGNKRTMRRGRRTRSSNLKYWPESHWSEVIRTVLDDDPEAVVVVTGTEHESELAGDILRGCDPDRTRNAAGLLPMRRLLALTERARGMISVDTGPAHAAAALGCPLVVLFGATDPRVFAPRSSRSAVRIVHAPSPEPEREGTEWWAAHHDMTDVAVAQVLEAWRSLPGNGDTLRLLRAQADEHA